MADTQFIDGSYLSRSWRMLTQDEGWWKPVLVLALVGWIPFVGPIWVMGYCLGWARLSAWNIDSAPKQRKVDIGGCLITGWRAFVVSLVWALVGALIGMLIVALLSTFGAVLMWIGLSLYSLVIDVAMMRTTIYQRIAPGFGLNQIFDMSGRDFTGLLKIWLIGLLRGLIVIAIAVVAVLIAMLFLSAPLTRLAMTYYYYGGSDLLVANAARLIGAIVAGAGPLIVLVGYIVSVVSTIFGLVITNALGLWIRQFNVPAWGAPADPVPPSIPSASPVYPPSPEGANPMAEPPKNPMNPEDRAPVAPEEAPDSPESVGEPVTPPTPEDLYHDATAATTHWTDVVSPTPDATFHMAWPEGGATPEPPAKADQHGVRPPTAPELYTEVSGEVAREWPDLDLQTQDATPTMDTPEMAAAVNADMGEAAKELGVEAPAPETAAAPKPEAPACEVPQSPVTPPTPEDLYHDATAATTRWTEVVTPPEPGTGSLGRPVIEESVKFEDDGETEADAEPAEREVYGQVSREVAATWPDVDLQSQDAVASIDSPEVRAAVDEAIAEAEGDGGVEHLIRPKDD